MKCPHCADASLYATRLDGGLLGEGCTHCGGALVSLLHYRDWAERSAGAFDDEPVPAPAPEPVPDGKGALCCPKCSRLMTKYRIGHGVSNALDLCATCDEAWLDNGEWRLLRALALSHHVPRIFTDAWQHRARQEQMDTARQTRLRAKLGDADAERLDALRDWLKDHPHRREILFALNQG